MPARRKVCRFSIARPLGCGQSLSEMERRTTRQGVPLRSTGSGKDCMRARTGNSFIQIPQSPLVARMIVDAGPDVADDWIAENIGPGDVAITNDIPLAERVLKAGGHAIAPNGKPFTENSIGSAIAQRALMEQLRSTGDILGGPKPFDRNDRSRFLQALDEVIQKERRRRA